MCLRKRKVKSIVLTGGFCFFFIQEMRSDCLHLSNKYARIVMPSVRLLNHEEITLDIPFFFRLKLIISLRNLLSPRPGDSLPHWFQGNFAATFVLHY